jgi:DNA-binding FadR family transcriptional regulator
MAEALGVGRTTLREALRLLETQGVLRIKPGPGGGPLVRGARPDDLVSAMTLLLQLLGATLEEVLVAREVLEPVIAARAATLATDEDAATLQGHIDTMRLGIDDFELFAKGNDAFHSQIAQMADNTVLLVLTETLEKMSSISSETMAYPPRTRARVADARERVVEAVRDRDPDAAAAATRLQVAEFRRFVTRKYPEILTRPIRWEMLDH